MKPLLSMTDSISKGPEACPRTKQTVFWGAAETIYELSSPGAHRGSVQASAMEQYDLKVSLSCREEEEGDLSPTEKDKTWLSRKNRN